MLPSWNNVFLSAVKYDSRTPGLCRGAQHPPHHSAELFLALLGTPSFPGRLVQGLNSMGSHLPRPPLDFLVKYSSKQANQNSTPRHPSGILHGALRHRGREHVLLIRITSQRRGVPHRHSLPLHGHMAAASVSPTCACGYGFLLENSPPITSTRKGLNLELEDKGLADSSRGSSLPGARSHDSLLTRSANIY